MTAENTVVMTALKEQLAAALPSRKFSRDLLDFNERAEADLLAGLYTLVAGTEDTFPNYHGREGNFATNHIKIVGQIQVVEKHPPVPSDIEDAENALIDEIKAFTRNAMAAPIDSLVVKSLQRSQQLSYPYGFVTFNMELMLS